MSFNWLTVIEKEWETDIGQRINVCFLCGLFKLAPLTYGAQCGAEVAEPEVLQEEGNG